MRRRSNNKTNDRRLSRHLSLEPVVSAARIDPFNCWPVAWNRDLSENFRFLIQSFGPSMFGYTQNEEGFDIFRTQAQVALKDPAAFHSLMIISTIRQGQVVGQTLPGINALWHRVEALRLIKDRIDSGSMDACTSEGSIYAVMCLMGIGAQWNAVDQNEFDSSALNKLIVYKGGLNIISEQHPILEVSLYGMAIISPGLLRSDLYAVNELTNLEQGQDSRGLLYGLLGFLRGIGHCKEKSFVALSQIQSAFGPGTPAYALLTSAPYHPGIPSNRQQKFQRRLTQHLVIYIFSILLWAEQHQVGQFLRHVWFLFDRSTIWQDSLRMLDWALVVNIPQGTLMFSQQAWQSYEILCALYCLEEGLQSDIMQCCLGLMIGNHAALESINDLSARIRTAMFKPRRGLEEVAAADRNT